MASKAKWKPGDLIGAIKTAAKQAEEKCKGLSSKDVVCLIGSTGSGKTTVANYALKNTIKVNDSGSGLCPEKVLAGFEMGDQYASLTRGMEAADLENKLCLVDLAGTGDTEGDIREIEGAIFRSSVLKSAHTVRIVLVFSITKLKVDRGKLFVQDLEHIAQMGKGLTDFPVGMVLTAEPDLLRDKDAGDIMVERMYDALPQLIEQVEKGNMEIKVPEVMSLLKYFEKHFNTAIEKGWLLSWFSGHSAVCPVNVTQPKHLEVFLTFLQKLPEILAPAHVLTCPLPQACQSELKAALGQMFQESTTACLQEGPAFAADSQLLQRMVDLLHLAAILKDLKLLPSASDLQDDLEEVVLCQNGRAAGNLVTGVALGTPAEVEKALSELSMMEGLRVKLEEQGVPASLNGWRCTRDSLKSACLEAQKAIDRHLPEGVAGNVKWGNPGLVNQVCGVFESVEKLGEPGVALLRGWASELVERSRQLEGQVANSADATGTLQALMRLKEQQEHLPRVAAVLGKHCEGLHWFLGAFERAKEALLLQLEGLSQDMGASPPDKLKDLCKSTELNAELGEDLVDRFISKPLIVALAVKQDDVDWVCKQLEDPEVNYAVWKVELQDLARRVETVAQLGTDVLRASGTSYKAFLDATKDQTSRAQQAVKDVFSRLKAFTEAETGSSWAGEERASKSQVYDALQTLVALLPTDPLLRLFSCPRQDMAGMALQTVFSLMSSSLKDCRRKAEEEKRSKCYAGAALDGDVIDAVNNLKICASLASVFLDAAPPSFQTDALTSIRGHLDDSEKLVESVLEKELEEWRQAEAGGRNWTQTFTHNLNTARRLKPLSPQKIGPCIHHLQKAVTNWQSQCLQAAEAALAAGNWKDFIDFAIRRGMDFELSELFSLMRDQQQFRPQFQPLVEDQAAAWKQAADASQYAASKPKHWEKLNAMCTALASLRRKTPEITELHSGLKDALRPLESTLHSNDERLLQTCHSKDFGEAVKLLRSVSDPTTQREVVMGYLSHYTETVREGLEVELEEGAVVQAIKNANKVIRDIETFNDDEVKREAMKHRDCLKKALDEKKGETSKRLQRALHSEHACLDRWLAICAWLNQKSKEHVAEKELAAFSCVERKKFEDSSLSDLSRWAVIHAGVRDSMPTEFKTCKEVLEGLTTEFVRQFKKACIKEREDLATCMRDKMWGDAKLKREMIQEAVADIDSLEMLRSRANEFKSMKRSVGLVPGDDTPMHDDLDRGDFGRAVHALVVSGNGDRADKICGAIHKALDAHMNVRAVDGSVNHTNLKVLESFLKAVGDHAPDELRELYNRVQLSCNEVNAQVSRQVDEGIKQMVGAAADQQLTGMAKALVGVERFKFRMHEKQRCMIEDATHDFWEAVSRAVEKVDRDIKGLDANALGMSVRPLDNWLQAFSALTKEQQLALMASLRSDEAVTDLGAWIRHALASRLQELVDGGTIVQQMQEQKFVDISKRCQVADKLHRTIQSEPVDLSPVKERLLQRKEEASGAVDQHNLAGFNKELKILKMANEELPEAGLEDDVAALVQDFNAKILEPLKDEIGKKTDIPGVVGKLTAMRTVADTVPEVWSTVMEAVTHSVTALQSNPSFKKSMRALGQHLATTQVGQNIVKEQSTFSMVDSMSLNALFRKAGQTQWQENVTRLASDSALDYEEQLELKSALKEHDDQLTKLQYKYLTQGKSIESVLKEVKSDLRAKVAQATTPEAGRALLTQLVATYMMVTCGKAYLEAEPEEQADTLVVPHNCQLLVLFRLLRLHRAGSNGSGPWSPGNGRREHQNHLAQVLTGEGKCLTLGLLAAFLALHGTESDIVCYREFLSEQDRKAMHPFLSFIGVEDKVRYATFDELCRERLQVIADASVSLLETRPAPQSKVMDKSERALLIDEVDVLFGRRFYGQTWDGAFKLRCPEAQALVRFVFNEEQAGRDASVTVLQSAQFVALTNKFSQEMQPVFTRAALALARNVKEWTSPPPELSKDGKRVGYKERDEIRFDISYANKTVFAYLTWEIENRINAEVAEENLGIDLVCGRFSFAELPKSYRFILGVTGTLSELLDVDGIRDVVQHDYKIDHFTYAPSVFGQRRLNFKEGEHVDVQLTEADWISRIEGLVQDEKKNAVLVFFKNSEMLKKYPNWVDLKCIEERTDPDRRNAHIRAATASGQVTLLTRSYGRGVDFLMPSGHEVVVVQTFLSSLVSEQTQIKGRTARQGRPGQYRLVLCAQHLEGKMAFSSDEVEQLRSGSGEDIKRLLAAKQIAKTKAKAASMKHRKEMAAELERETRAWESLLFRPGEPVAKKLGKLADWNTKQAQVHYSLLLDNSGSMTFNWEQLADAFESFCSAVQNDALAQACTTISVVLFNRQATIISPHHVKVSEVHSIRDHKCMGGTDFSAAFRECHALLCQPQATAKEFILFMTDGGACFPKDVLDAVLSDHGPRIKNVTCVAFGADADVSCLELISKHFTDAGVPATVKSPENTASLVEVFTEAAESAIHGV